MNASIRFMVAGKLFWCCFLLAFSFQTRAQVFGRISDPQGEPLSFASIYVAGTSTGTTSNIEGDYTLPLKPGTYKLVFQYLGYQAQTIEVQMTSRPKELNVALQLDALELAAVEISANAEDPAYAIIRKAIQKRKYYRELIEAYSCKVYIKGAIKLLETPEKFLGQEIGDLNGNLDSTGKGIIYLSESESRLYMRQPDQVKEIMVSSKVSGDDNGFSFNSAGDMDFNFYDNFTEYSRPIVSPIANNALNYYNYHLLGSFYDDEGHLINKIELTPKSAEYPAYQGVIYIVEDLWNIQGVDVFLTASSLNQPALDTLFIRQVHVPVQAPDRWRLFSQTLTLRGAFFKFKFGGDFTGIYTDYDLNPDLPSNFFNNEIFKVEEGANEVGLTYFDTIRPLPLTLEEKVDYVKKDSLQEVRTSKIYLDSIDRKNNRFTIANLFLGYAYANSYKRLFYSISSPLTTVQFNTIQGFYGYSEFAIRKNFDEQRTRWIRGNAILSYGLADKRFRPLFGLTYHFDEIRFTELAISGGVRTPQFDPVDPISPSVNALYSLYFKRNFAKLYERRFGEIDLKMQPINGLSFRLITAFQNRRPLVNNTDYSFFYRDSRQYDSNDPLDPENFEPTFEPHNALTLNLELRFRPNQKYIQYPNRRFLLGSDWPDFILHYLKGIPVTTGEGSSNPSPDYDLLALGLEKTNWQLGAWGNSSIRLEAGIFLNTNQLYFMDFRHFHGNETVLGNPVDYLQRFFQLPYYSHSTDDRYWEAHYEHQFEGFLLDRIPGIRKLGLTSVVSAKHLYTPNMGHYSEIAFGIDKIGFNLFRLLRADLIWIFEDGQYQDLGFLIGIRLPTN